MISVHDIANNDEHVCIRAQPDCKEDKGEASHSMRMTHICGGRNGMISNAASLPASGRLQSRLGREKDHSGHLGNPGSR